ncbi:hypothetical protein FDP41_001465 [Naegleria fowleri]|uniref:PH domain-containing protein n=1 Tax=Naegleria fowleri TaxID=5763 RepID=A0A6A5BQT0_NAEFO|nr:uncharacterized protein FDP41_001465 [Naegleria fowleri]KAF0979487.1 hypothetical protein FDP41_001465 [Naegleria fowleri]
MSSASSSLVSLSSSTTTTTTISSTPSPRGSATPSSSSSTGSSNNSSIHGMNPSNISTLLLDFKLRLENIDEPPTFIECSRMDHHLEQQQQQQLNDSFNSSNSSSLLNHQNPSFSNSFNSSSSVLLLSSSNHKPNSKLNSFSSSPSYNHHSKINESIHLSSNSRHSLLSSSLRSSMSSPAKSGPTDARGIYAQEILDQINEWNQQQQHEVTPIVSTSILSFNSNTLGTTLNMSASNSESPLKALVFGYATLMVCSTKNLSSQSGHVIHLLNKAEYKLRNAITCCELSREYSLDLMLKSDLHLLLARILYELSFPRLDELERESSQMSSNMSNNGGSSSNVGMNSPLQNNAASSISPPIKITDSQVVTGNNMSPSEPLSAPNLTIGTGYSLGSLDNVMAVSLDSPVRASFSSKCSSPSPRGGMTSPTSSSQKAAQQAQQQIENMFQDICLHMDSAIKLFEKSTQKPKRKHLAYMYMYFGDVLTQWSVRRKQRWAALCSQAQEKYNTCIKICIEKILSTIDKDKDDVCCINSKFVRCDQDGRNGSFINYVYCPLHHQCLYKYAVLLLYWVRRKREHSTIYSGENSSSSDTMLSNFDYESTLTAVNSVGTLTLNYSEFQKLESRLNAEQNKAIPRHAQSILQNNVASESEKLCKGCVSLWESVCNVEMRKAEIFCVEHNVNPHLFFRLSNSIYEYALLLIPSASILACNDYLSMYDNIDGEPMRNCSRSEILTSGLSWHDLLFKHRMLDDKKELLRENNRKILSDQTSKTVVLDENNKDDLRLRYSLIYSDKIGDINIRTILTRESLMEKAIEAIDKACSIMKKQQKSEAETLNESMQAENRVRLLKEVDDLFTSSIVALNKVLEAKPFHMVAMAILGEVYFFWARAKFGKESDKHIQNAIEIWSRLLTYSQYTGQYNLSLDHISKMISFALEIRKGIIICDGMALKQGKLRKSWTERYFLLTIEHFGYYEIKSNKSLKKKKMKNTVPTDEIEYVKQNLEEKFTSNKDYPFCLEVVCKKRVFYICYSSQKELDRWDAAFEYVILMNQIMKPSTTTTLTITSNSSTHVSLTKPSK